MSYSLWNTIQHYGYCNKLLGRLGGRGFGLRSAGKRGAINQPDKKWLKGAMCYGVQDMTQSVHLCVWYHTL